MVETTGHGTHPAVARYVNPAGTQGGQFSTCLLLALLPLQLPQAAPPLPTVPTHRLSILPAPPALLAHLGEPPLDELVPVLPGASTFSLTGQKIESDQVSHWTWKLLWW